MVDTNLCIGGEGCDYICAADIGNSALGCPVDAIVIDDSIGKPVVNVNCYNCNFCIEHCPCPTNAIMLR